MNSEWLTRPVKSPDESHLTQAQQRQAQLTKPPGSLGQLETIAVRLAAMQGSQYPAVDNIQISVFAADHGVAAENVSAFPQVVTTEMVRNFARGGAAISVLAKQLNARLEVVDVGTVHDPGPLDGVIAQRIAAGTANFSQQPAMSEQQCERALQAGYDSIQRAVSNQVQLFIGGEMGIANTTAAAAVAAALLDKDAVQLVGPGTGLDNDGVKHKAAVVNQAINLHKAALRSPLDVLRCLGGFEIAALTGCYLAAAQQGISVLVDGFIASVAALLATKLNPAAAQWWFFSHQSAEPGHVAVLEALHATPLLDLDMRLGEGSGAAVASSLLQHACSLHNQMATFAEAGVTDNG